MHIVTSDDGKIKGPSLAIHSGSSDESADPGHLAGREVIMIRRDQPEPVAGPITLFARLDRATAARDRVRARSLRRQLFALGWNVRFRGVAARSPVTPTTTHELAAGREQTR